MKPTSFRRSVPPTLIAIALSPAFPALAFDVNEQFSIGGILAPTGQCQSVSALLPAESYGGELVDESGAPLVDPATGDALLDDSMDPFDDECRGGMPFQLELSYHPNDSNELFVKLGFAVANGLNEVSPWVLAPWAVDLEDDVKDINGRNRDYLLTAWYKYTQKFENGSLGASIGIIDSTDYIDGNEYADDEFAKFMNEAFVHAPTSNLSSYDAGAALELELGDWRIAGLGMNVGENDYGNNFNFWGGEIGYHPETNMGPGNYRLTVTGTSSAFLDPTETKEESLLSYGFSFDQAFGEILGAFLRFNWQEEDAAVDYKAQYSGGLNFSGKGWNRDEDNIGIGYAYLEGGNGDVDETQVFEAYYRAVLNEFAAITADVQYMDDDLVELDPRQDDPDGWIFGLRLTAEL